MLDKVSYSEEDDIDILRKVISKHAFAYQQMSPKRKNPKLALKNHAFKEREGTSFSLHTISFKLLDFFSIKSLALFHLSYGFIPIITNLIYSI